MAERFSLGKIDVELTASMEQAERAPAPAPDTPFRILLLGDFSGRANRGIVEPDAAGASGKPVRVDRDNLEEVLGRLGAELHLHVAGNEGPRVTLQFEGLDALHPDRIFERVEIFRGLRETREGLNDPKTYEAAAGLVRAWVLRDEAPRAPQPAEEDRAAAPSSGIPGSEDLVRELLEATERRAREERAAPGREEWKAFLRQIVQPHLIPREDPQKAELMALVDHAIGALMRAVLHHPDFQALEAGWRALDFLVRRLDTNGQLQLYLLDRSTAELAAELDAVKDLRASRISKLLVEETIETPGGHPWAVLAAGYTFDQTLQDVLFLSRLAKIARAASAPFLAAASPRLVGCASLAETPDPDDWRRPEGMVAEAWEALRELPEASSLGLALPRFLLRLPYGREGEPAEGFDFEELPEGSRHEEYLWGNPAFACALLLGQAFSEYAWELRPGVLQDIAGLPLHVYKEGGESRAKPCGEALLTLRAAETILERGLMPLLSIKGRDAVRLGRFQSLRNPLTSLAGRWGS